MGEVKRIVGRKKYAFMVIALFVINILLFQYFQLDTVMMLNNPEYHDGILAVWEQEREDKIREFYERHDIIKEQKESMLGISIFANEDSFAYKNIIKTQKDFEKLSQVHIDNINDRAVTAFLEYDELYIIGFIIVMFTVLSFFDERKKGLWQLVYSCRNGRLILTLKRLVILMAVSFFTGFLLIAETLTVSFIDYGGEDILRAAAQSATALQDFVMTVKVYEFVIYYIFVYSAALFISGAFVWCILETIHNRNTGMITCVAVYGFEFYIYNVLSPQNPFCIFKYTNMFFIACPRQIFTEYRNFAAFGMLFNLREYFTWLAVALVFLFAVWVIVAGVFTRPVYVPGRFEKISERFFDRLRRVLCAFNGMGYELYKCLIQCKGIIVFMVFAYIMVSAVNTGEIFMSPGRELLSDFYAEHTCEINDDMLRLYEDMEREVKESEEKYMISLESENKMLDELHSQIERKDRLAERGISGWFIDERGFEWIIGKNNMLKRLTGGILGVLALILLIVPVYSAERQSEAENIIRCTKKGRGKIFVRKLIYVVLCTFAVSTIIYAAELYEIMLNYSLKGLAAPVQNIKLLESFPFDISIGAFLGIWYAVRTLVLFAAACISMCISVFNVRQDRAYLASLPLLPAGLLSGVSEYTVYNLSMAWILPAAVVCAVCAGTSIAITYGKWR